MERNIRFATAKTKGSRDSGKPSLRQPPRHDRHRIGPNTASGGSQSTVRGVADADMVKRLMELGGPEISVDEHRKLDDESQRLLACLMDRVKGRQGTRGARRDILRYQNERSKSQIPQPQSVLPVDHEATRARADLEAVTLSVEATRKEVQEAEKSLSDLKMNYDELQREVEAKRKTKLLLDVLEKRETIRVVRLKEVGILMQRLRNAVESREPNRPVAEQPPSIRPSKASKSSKYITETLANLHAYHLRVSRFSGKEVSLANEETMVARLRSLTDSDDHLERARLLAQRSLQYRSDLPVEGVADERLNEMLEVNNSKIRQIKNVLERTGVLGQDSERLIRTIEVYKERTYPRLRDSIVEDQTLFVAGYIKDLQGWTYPVSEGASSLSSRVAELLKLGRHADEDAVIAAVRDMSNQGHAQELLFSQSLPAPQGFEDLNALKVAYQTTSSAADEKAITLLSRKIEKGARGNEIIKDAQELLKEAEAVVNGEIRAS